MEPLTYDLNIFQGTTFTLPIIWKDSNGVPIDLTGYVARMQIRKRVSSPEVLAELTTENGRIVLGGAAGTITLNLSASETSAIQSRNAVYDLELQAPDLDGTVTRLINGAVVISYEVTRP